MKIKFQKQFLFYGFLKKIRSLVGVFIKVKPIIPTWDIVFSNKNVEISGEMVSELIYKLLKSDRPILISRFGSDILMAAMDYCNRPNLSNILKYLTFRTNTLGLRLWTVKLMNINAGFFPSNRKLLYNYGKLIVDVLPNIDVLGSIMEQESYFKNELINADFVNFLDLEPFYHKNPWTRALKGKKVLVIHPFEASIRFQYFNNREKLFENKDVLPEFELLTIKAIQSISGNKPNQFETWFEAFDFLKNEIDKVQFDIAIIGCGSYGMPIASYIKNKGKKAIHLGGSTQLLFGIKGRRWEVDYENDFYRKMFNEHWIKPLHEDYPIGYEKIENGCYW